MAPEVSTGSELPPGACDDTEDRETLKNVLEMFGDFQLVKQHRMDRVAIVFVTDLVRDISARTAATPPQQS